MTPVHQAPPKKSSPAPKQFKHESVPKSQEFREELTRREYEHLPFYDEKKLKKPTQPDYDFDYEEFMALAHP